MQKGDIIQIRTTCLHMYGLAWCNYMQCLFFFSKLESYTLQWHNTIHTYMYTYNLTDNAIILYIN